MSSNMGELPPRASGARRAAACACATRTCVRHQAERWHSLLALDHRAHADAAAGDGNIALALAACGAK